MPKVICRGQFLFEKSAQLIYVFNEAQVSGADHHVKGLWLNGSLTPGQNELYTFIIIVRLFMFCAVAYS